MTTKFTDQCSYQFSKTIHRRRQSEKVREKRHIIKETRTQCPCMTSAYSRSSHSSRYSPKPTDKVVTFFDETITKHPYLNIDDVALAFNQ